MHFTFDIDVLKENLIPILIAIEIIFLVYYTQFLGIKVLADNKEEYVQQDYLVNLSNSFISKGIFHTLVYYFIAPLATLVLILLYKRSFPFAHSAYIFFIAGWLFIFFSFLNYKLTIDKAVKAEEICEKDSKKDCKKVLKDLYRTDEWILDRKKIKTFTSPDKIKETIAILNLKKISDKSFNELKKIVATISDEDRESLFEDDNGNFYELSAIYNSITLNKKDVLYKVTPKPDTLSESYATVNALKGDKIKLFLEAIILSGVLLISISFKSY
jgi:hypothetical protein